MRSSLEHRNLHIVWKGLAEDRDVLVEQLLLKRDRVRGNHDTPAIRNREH